MTYTPQGNRATNAPFEVLDGNNSLQTVTINQELAPDDFADQGTDWEDLGIFTINSGSLNVVLSDDADEFVIADAVRVESVNNNIVGSSQPIASAPQPASAEPWRPFALVRRLSIDSLEQSEQSRSVAFLDQNQNAVLDATEVSQVVLGNEAAAFQGATPGVTVLAETYDLSPLSDQGNIDQPAQINTDAEVVEKRRVLDSVSQVHQESASKLSPSGTPTDSELEELDVEDLGKSTNDIDSLFSSDGLLEALDTSIA